MSKIVVPDDSPIVLAASPAYPALLELGDVRHFDTLAGTEAALLERIRDAEIVVNIRSSAKFTAEVMESCQNLGLISIWGTGTDNVDLGAAARRGVAVTNTPGVSAFSVAEHALALMLAVARDIPAQDRAMRNRQWPRAGGIELRGKTLGVIGLGAIGRRFAELGRAIGMRVIAWTMHPRAEAGLEQTGLDELLRTSGVVSLHVRLSAETRHMIGARELGLMKPTAILVNTARGAVVDEAALVQALTARQIAGAGLDVFAVEPLPSGHPLAELPNVVLSPHSAGITPEALNAGLQMAVDNVRAFLRGRPVNLVAASAR
jgi:phosphoglycerate dehydrogenase-like enzyme